VRRPITTASGSASACSRAAKFGVSPTTDHRPLPRLAGPDQLADHHRTGGDADAHLEWLQVRLRPQAVDAFDDAEAGADRPLGVVLVRPGPAEIGQHAVAHVLGDVALEAGDLAGDSVLVGAEQPWPSPRGRADR
jgi:hypothetical protein